MGLLAAMLFVGYWTYVFLPGSRPENPDLLNEPAFLVQAERMCAATAKLVSELPGAAAAAGPEERAAQIRATNDLWQQLVNELSDLAARSSAARNREIVNGWISDWRIYLSDRVSYAETLAEGEDPPFTVTSRRGRGVTEYMTAFAETNGMSSCGTPDDV